nr:U4/U6 small nuclear ribonucleoprotein Prp31 homolog [Tanacetum cinerariifolium]
GWTRRRIWYAWTRNGKLGVSVGQSKLTAKVNKKLKVKQYSSGVTLSLAFTPVQGINLIDPRPDINGNQ